MIHGVPRAFFRGHLRVPIAAWKAHKSRKVTLCTLVKPDFDTLMAYDVKTPRMSMLLGKAAPPLGTTPQLQYLLYTCPNPIDLFGKQVNQKKS